MSTDEETVERLTSQKKKKGAQNTLHIRKRKELNLCSVDYYAHITNIMVTHAELDPIHFDATRNEKVTLSYRPNWTVKKTGGPTLISR